MSTINAVGASPFVPDVVKTIAQQQAEFKPAAQTGTAASTATTAAAGSAEKKTSQPAAALSRNTIASMLSHSTATDLMSALGLSGSSSDNINMSTLASALSSYKESSAAALKTMDTTPREYSAPVVKNELNQADSAALERAQKLIKGVTINTAA